MRSGALFRGIMPGCLAAELSGLRSCCCHYHAHAALHCRAIPGLHASKGNHPAGHRLVHRLVCAQATEVATAVAEVTTAPRQLFDSNPGSCWLLRWPSRNLLHDVMRRTQN